MARFLHFALAASLLLTPAAAFGVPIGPGDFGSGSTVLTFDEFSNGTFLSGEFAPQGVTLGSGPTPDGLNGGGTPAPFVATENEFPSATASPPNKVIGTINHPTQGLIKCQSCAVVVTFLSPLPTQAGFWIADPDLGQFAEFFGPSGLVDSLGVTTADSSSPFFVGVEDLGGITEIVLHSTAQLGVGLDNLQFGSPVPEPSSAALVMAGIALVVFSGRRIGSRRFAADSREPTSAADAVPAAPSGWHRSTVSRAPSPVRSGQRTRPIGAE